jgi:hypothetical protein
MNQRITVPQVARNMGVTLDKKTAWSVGSEMASIYYREFGEQPPKDNRPKTNGAGSHCFALYPSSWEVKIKNIIESHVEHGRNQHDLFDGNVDDRSGP